MKEEIKDLMDIICEGQDSIQRQQVENYIFRLEKTINEIRKVVNNEKVSGIEAKLIIKDILDKEYKL